MVIEYKLGYHGEQVWLLYINSLLPWGAVLVIVYKLIVTMGTSTGYCI